MFAAYSGTNQQKNKVAKERMDTMKRYEQPVLSVVDLRQEERIAAVIPGNCMVPDPDNLLSPEFAFDMDDSCWKVKDGQPGEPCS